MARAAGKLAIGDQAGQRRRVQQPADGEQGIDGEPSLDPPEGQGAEDRAGAEGGEQGAEAVGAEPEPLRRDDGQQGPQRHSRQHEQDGAEHDPPDHGLVPDIPAARPQGRDEPLPHAVHRDRATAPHPAVRSDHADPAPDAFLRQPDTDQVALIDWSATTRPVLHDVASALMYLGGRQNAASFWTAYVDHSPASSAELVDHLGALTRYRAAVQAAYFSWRIATVDNTGILDHDENWKGLRDAELMLRANDAEMVNWLS